MVLFEDLLKIIYFLMETPFYSKLCIKMLEKNKRFVDPAFSIARMRFPLEWRARFYYLKKLIFY